MQPANISDAIMESLLSLLQVSVFVLPVVLLLRDRGVFDAVGRAFKHVIGEARKGARVCTGHTAVETKKVRWPSSFTMEDCGSSSPARSQKKGLNQTPETIYSSRKRTTARGATPQAARRLRTTDCSEPVHPAEDEITIHVEEIHEPRVANAVAIKTQRPVEIQEDLSCVSEAAARDIVSPDVTRRGDEEQLENTCMLNRDVEMSAAADDVSHLLSRLLSAPVSESCKSHLLSELTALRAQQEVDKKLKNTTETSLELRRRSRAQEEEYERAKLELSARFKAEEEKRMEEHVRELMEDMSRRKSEEDKRMRQLEEQEEERRRKEMEQERRVKEQENELIREKQKLEALARVNTAVSNSPSGTIASMSPPRGDISASALLNSSLPAGSAHAGLFLSLYRILHNADF